MIEIPLAELRGYFGFGVAGNFAGHLEQAGEADDFVNVGDAGAEAPKGIFPFYAPGRDGYLGQFPLSHDRIAEPPSIEPLNLQIEPELGVVFEVVYLKDGSVGSIAPIAAAAFNDCSIRRPATKISVKKNWGADSKGVAKRMIPTTELAVDGATQYLRIASFMRRGEETFEYGVDTPVSSYTYFGDQLLNWIVDRLEHQKGSAQSPLEPVGEYLRDCGNPPRVVVAVGATRYTPFGETTFLGPGDQAIVVVYDGASHTANEVARAIAQKRDDQITSASILRQTVYGSHS